MQFPAGIRILRTQYKIRFFSLSFAEYVAHVKKSTGSHFSEWIFFQYRPLGEKKYTDFYADFRSERKIQK
jgi:hypothetical protein